ncbi:hypothetical protein WCE12_09290 [Acinetobacter radioresistens]|uniref:hypothetical protein n=1 Tax=Acinetobacter radioresistens TaxID=40216 RepID=UPI0034D45181
MAAKQYVAQQPLGRFKKGDFVGGLTDAEIRQQLDAGTIKEVEPPSEESKPAAAKTTKEVKADGK